MSSLPSLLFVAQADLESSVHLASVFLVLSLQACATRPGKSPCFNDTNAWLLCIVQASNLCQWYVITVVTVMIVRSAQVCGNWFSKSNYLVCSSPLQTACSTHVPR